MSLRIPDACTLPTVEQPLRQAEFVALCGSALRGQERVSDRRLRLTLSGGDDLLETVLDLTARESDCCSFFEFMVTPSTVGVVLDIEVPAEHTGVLDGLSELAGSAPSSARATS